MRRQWTYEQIPLGDIYYSQDTIRDMFADGRSLSNLIAWFKHSDDPDQGLCDNRISVVPYPSGTSALYTLDNRRLFCLKFVYPPTLSVCCFGYIDMIVCKITTVSGISSSVQLREVRVWL